jgi:very-short-patch-repair endonuclease
MSAERRIDVDNRRESVARAGDGGIAALAGRQHGVVARRQLRALGLSEQAIERRLRAGRLHLLHRGVYAVGHRVLSRRGLWMAAVLACGPDAVLSHAAAAALWDVRASGGVRIDVTVLGAGGRSRAPLRIHRRPTLRPEETSVHDGIPVTTPARTLLDLAATLTPRQLERALDQTEVLRLFDLASFDALLAAHAGERGVGRLRDVLRSHTAGTTLTRSKLEELLLALCRRRGLPPALVNEHVAGEQRDFVFPRHRLVVETDSWEFHRTRAAFENDRRRDAELARAGWRTLRFTHRQLTNAPNDVAQALEAALNHANPGTPTP